MIVILDYGVGNLYNIKKVLQFTQKKIIISNNIKKILKADLLILPGVGSFEFAIKNLKKKKLENAVIKYVKTGKPVLATCVGMQILMTKSYENGIFKGLNLIKGKVKNIRNLSKKIKLPIIGWHKIIPNTASNIYQKLNLKNKYFYFVHSYYVEPDEKKYIIAYYSNGIIKYPAIVKKDNIIGFQFHFEISGDSGKKLIKELIKELGV
jgi:glutamine amidotransferase